jgi:hypothetical protein
MQVCVALPVNVRDVVDGGATGPNLEVLPVLRVETAIEDLMRLALTAVLCEKDARTNREQIGGGAVGSGREHGAPSHALARRAPR